MFALIKRIHEGAASFKTLQSARCESSIYGLASIVAMSRQDQRDPDGGADCEEDGAEFDDIGSAAEEQDAAEEGAHDGRSCGADDERQEDVG